MQLVFNMYRETVVIIINKWMANLLFGMGGACINLDKIKNNFNFLHERNICPFQSILLTANVDSKLFINKLHYNSTLS